MIEYHMICICSGCFTRCRISACHRGVRSVFLGMRLTSLFVSAKSLKQIFGTLIVVMTAYKLVLIFSR